MPNFYEFFAGGGMARAGLGPGWNCLFANDIDSTKAISYRENWGTEQLLISDVNHLTTDNIPGQADLAWASFPCQDLSLAGNNAGIGHPASEKQTRSGTFWPFWNLMLNLKVGRRAPRLIVLENVRGALTSNEGRDFSAVCLALLEGQYRFGALVIDAKYFVPQSRPRLFVLAIRDDLTVPGDFRLAEPREPWHSDLLIKAHKRLSEETKRQWIWWQLPSSEVQVSVFSTLIEENPQGVEWHTPQETQYILSLMSALNLGKVQDAMAAGRIMVGGVYRRTRSSVNGIKLQRAEVRFDDIAGCLRTPSGGSSRQTILVINGQHLRSRLLSPREAARLMGLDDAYRLPHKYNDAYHLAGDGVVVPVVRHLAEHLLGPLLEVNAQANCIGTREERTAYEELECFSPAMQNRKTFDTKRSAFKSSRLIAKVKAGASTYHSRPINTRFPKTLKVDLAASRCP